MSLDGRSGLASATFSAVSTFRRDTPVLAVIPPTLAVHASCRVFRLVLQRYQANGLRAYDPSLLQASLDPPPSLAPARAAGSQHRFLIIVRGRRARFALATLHGHARSDHAGRSLGSYADFFCSISRFWRRTVLRSTFISRTILRMACPALRRS